MKKLTKLQSDIKFIKEIASEHGHTISDAEAKKAIKICKGDYYRMKEYFFKLIDG